MITVYSKMHLQAFLREKFPSAISAHKFLFRCFMFSPLRGFIAFGVFVDINEIVVTDLCLIWFTLFIGLEIHRIY